MDINSLVFLFMGVDKDIILVDEDNSRPYIAISKQGPGKQCPPKYVNNFSASSV